MDIQRSWKRISATEIHCGRFTVRKESQTGGWSIFWDREYQGDAEDLTHAKRWMKYRWKALECFGGIKETRRPK